MGDDYIYQLCCINKNAWPEVREYLSSDALDEEKKRNVMYKNSYHSAGLTCLQLFCFNGAPADIVKALLAIGGKELITETNDCDLTALHFACGKGYNGRGASFDVIKVLIDIGRKGLVMATNEDGNTALHCLCCNVKDHTNAADKIKLMLEVGDTNVLLSAKGNNGKTPLQIATEKGASNIIKSLLAPQSNFKSTNNNNNCYSNSSSNVASTDNSSDIPIKQSHHNQQTTSQSSSTKNDPNDAIHKLQAQLNQAQDQAIQIQQACDQHFKHCTILEDTLQTFKKKVEIRGEEIATLVVQKEQGENDTSYWKDRVDNLSQICFEQKARLQEMEDHKSEGGTKRKKCNGDEHLISVSHSLSKGSKLKLYPGVHHQSFQMQFKRRR